MNSSLYNTECSVRVLRAGVRERAAMLQIESDKESRFALKDYFRPVVLMFIENAHQSSLSVLYKLVSNFLQSRFFINEKVYHLGKTDCFHIITKISPITGSFSTSEDTVYDPDNVIYTLKTVRGKDVGNVFFAESTEIQKLKQSCGGLNNFIKDNVIKKDDVIRVKPHCYEKYVTEKNLSFSKVFIGRIPDLPGLLEPTTMQETIEFSQKCDDLELHDQKPLPVYQTVKTSVPIEYFGDVLMVCEFMHSFSNILSKNISLNGYNIFNEVTRALTQRKINGPLTELFITLLKTIFNLQEPTKHILRHTLVNGTEFGKQKDIDTAYDTYKYVIDNFSLKPNELPVDKYTLSEVLRLHLLASGAGAKKTSDGDLIEDPGMVFCRQNPEVLQKLKTLSIYQLPISDLLAILKTLIAQILTYPQAIDEIAEKKVQQEANEKTILPSSTSRSAQLTTRQAKSLKSAENELKDKLGKRALQAKVYLGMDRAYRRYYVLMSVPAVFVEHATDTPSECLDNSPVISSHLMDCPQPNHLIEKNSKRNKTRKTKNQFETSLVDSNENVLNKDTSTKGHISSLEMNASSTVTAERSVNIEKLFMCTGDPSNCIVHNARHPNRRNWTFFYKEEDIDAVLEALNSHGDRESKLKKNLKSFRDLIVQLTKNCPVDNLSSDASTIKNEVYQKDVNMVFTANLAHQILSLETELPFADRNNQIIKNLKKWRDELVHFCDDSNQQSEPSKRNEHILTYNDIHNDLNGNIASSNNQPPSLQSVKNFSYTLLQIKRIIEEKFIEKSLPKWCFKSLEKWQYSLRNATSFSQVFLHLNSLNKAIERNNSNLCTTCHEGMRSDNKMTCVKCKAGLHISCLRVNRTVTRSTAVWTCDKCHREEFKEKLLKRRFDGFEFRTRSKIRKQDLPNYPYM